MTIRRSLLALLFSAFGTWVATAQAPPTGGGSPPAESASAGIPDRLEDMIALALGSNPEVLQAEAKLRLAQANLNQVRLRTTQDVIETFHEPHNQGALLHYA